MAHTTHNRLTDGRSGMDEGPAEDEDEQLLEAEEGVRERVDLPLTESFEEDADEDADDPGAVAPEE